MAGLQKPTKCECGSTSLHREYHPERWICDTCEAIVSSRGSKPTTGVCTKCGAKKSDGVEFKPRKNLCMDCYNTHMRDWHDKNRDERLQYKKTYYADNRDAIRARNNAYWQSGWKPFLSDLFNRAKKSAKGKFGSRARELDFEITREFLMELLERQEFRCAITGIPLVHRWGNVRSASIDRIDSEGHYTPDNVQLLCKCVNLMKHQNTNEEIWVFLEEYHRLRLAAKRYAENPINPDYYRNVTIEDV